MYSSARRSHTTLLRPSQQEQSQSLTSINRASISSQSSSISTSSSTKQKYAHIKSRYSQGPYNPSAESQNERLLKSHIQKSNSTSLNHSINKSSFSSSSSLSLSVRKSSSGALPTKKRTALGDISNNPKSSSVPMAMDEDDISQERIAKKKRLIRSLPTTVSQTKQSVPTASSTNVVIAAKQSLKEKKLQANRMASTRTRVQATVTRKSTILQPNNEEEVLERRDSGQDHTSLVPITKAKKQTPTITTYLAKENKVNVLVPAQQDNDIMAIDDDVSIPVIKTYAASVQSRDFARPTKTRVRVEKPITGTLESGLMDLERIKRTILRNSTPHTATPVTKLSFGEPLFRDPDPLLMTEYAEDIFLRLKETEALTMADPMYMNRQRDISWGMRKQLIRWLSQVSDQFRLHGETFYLSVNVMDRFLSAKHISVSKFQLVGIASLFLAAKFEEIQVPSVQDLEYMVDRGYSREELLQAERYILGLLKFELNFPSPFLFLRRITKEDGYNKTIRDLGKYFLEILVLDPLYLEYTPSYAAALCMFLARKTVNDGEWAPGHQKASGFSEGELVSGVYALLERVKHHMACSTADDVDISLFGKYDSSQYQFVARNMKLFLEQMG